MQLNVIRMSFICRCLVLKTINKMIWIHHLGTMMSEKQFVQTHLAMWRYCTVLVKTFDQLVVLWEMSKNYQNLKDEFSGEHDKLSKKSIIKVKLLILCGLWMSVRNLNLLSNTDSLTCDLIKPFFQLPSNFIGQNVSNTSIRKSTDIPSVPKLVIGLP